MFLRDVEVFIKIGMFTSQNTDKNDNQFKKLGEHLLTEYVSMLNNEYKPKHNP